MTTRQGSRSESRHSPDEELSLLDSIIDGYAFLLQMIDPAKDPDEYREIVGIIEQNQKELNLLKEKNPTR